MAEQLLPCPFCGGIPAVRLTGLDGCLTIHVACDCGVKMFGSWEHFSSPEDAIAAWNRRASPWQPIETAPTNKRVIGLWLGAPGCEEIDTAYHCVGGTLISEPADADYWCSPHDCTERYAAPDMWMPLRAAPEVRND